MHKLNLRSCVQSLEDSALEKLTLDLHYDKVELSGLGCRLWQGAIDAWGYGRLYITGFGNAYAHRTVLALEGIDVDAYEVVRHLCHNPRCCNPHHLQGGTQQENVDDRERLKCRK